MATKKRKAPAKKAPGKKQPAKKAPGKRKRTVKKAELKTKANSGSVAGFLASVDDKRRADCEKLLEIFQRATGEQPRMWGSSIVGFGEYSYVYESGRAGEFMLTGFSPRKANLTLYIMPGFAPYGGLLKKLGPCSTARSCLYLKRLDGIDLGVLEQLVRDSTERMRKKPPRA